MRETEPITVGTILSLDREERVPVIDRRLATLIHRLDDRAAELAYVNSLSEGLQTLWATYSLDAEVTNGGFQQFFYNHCRIYAEEARRGLQKLGAPDHLRLLDEALAILRDLIPNPNPVDPGWRAIYNPLTGGDRDVFGHLDKAWYDLDSTWYSNLQDYVDRHPEEFVTE